MKPVYIEDQQRKRTYQEVVPDIDRSAFVFRIFSEKEIHDVRHLHGEMELILIRNGHGTKTIGDLSLPCIDGDVTLIGPGVPHFYTVDPADASKPVEAWVIQWNKYVFGTRFFEYTECYHLHKLMEASAKGVCFSSRTIQKTHEVWNQLTRAERTDRIVLFLKLLGILAYPATYMPLAGATAWPESTPKPPERLSKVIEHIHRYYNEPTPVSQMAALVGLSNPAFCNLFRKSTGTHFTDYLTETRLGHAARLLAETDLPVNAIYDQCGFANQSYFNRRFRAYFRCSPLEYRRRLKE